MIEQFLEIKRCEYDYAVKHNLFTLQKIIRHGVKQVIKYHNYQIKPSEQLKLF